MNSSKKNKSLIDVYYIQPERRNLNYYNRTQEKF